MKGIITSKENVILPKEKEVKNLEIPFGKTLSLKEVLYLMQVIFLTYQHNGELDFPYGAVEKVKKSMNLSLQLKN